MVLAPLKPAPSAAQAKAATAAQPAVFTSAAPQTKLSGTPPVKIVLDATVAVERWMDEVEASAPPPSTLAFSIHMRRQAARLVELLGE